MSSTAFEVKFEEPKKSVPENLLSPREPVNPNAVKLRVEHKLKVADDRRKSQLENVISKQKKHGEHIEKVRVKAAEIKKESS